MNQKQQDVVGASSAIACPVCGQECISKAALVLSIFRAFSYPRCANCGHAFSAGKRWQENMLGIAVLAAYIAATLAARLNSLVPYIVAILLVGAALGAAYVFSKPIPVVKLAVGARLIDWIVVAMVIGVISYSLSLVI